MIIRHLEKNILLNVFCRRVKSRFELIQAELEANPTLYYVIHGRPYVPPRIVLNKVRLHHHTIFETKSAAPF